MYTLTKIAMLLLLSVSIGQTAEPQIRGKDLFPKVRTYTEQRVQEFDKIPEERKRQLKQIAQYVSQRVQAKQPANLTFICTHNSRRSHLSQICAAVAADYYGIPGVETFSGGTEATAFNPRAIAAIERIGLRIQKTGEGANPRYEVRFSETARPLLCFSKAYHESPNPKSDFCAVLTCSQADETCPTVPGAAVRVAIHFQDPKIADNTPEEAGRYDERVQQISREMLYVFSLVR